MHVLALGISQRFQPRGHTPRARQAESCPMTEQRRRAQSSETQTISLRGVTTGRKTTFWASPFQNIQHNVYAEGTSRWASEVTSLPFCTRGNKKEIGKNSQRRKIKAEKLKRDHMRLGNVGKH